MRRKTSSIISVLLSVIMLFTLLPFNVLAATGITIVSQPTDVYCQSGDDASFTVDATGSGLTYQWYYKRTDMAEFSAWSNQKTNTLSFPASSRHDGMQVNCIVKDSNGQFVTTNTATLHIGAEPIVITSQPDNSYCQPGDTVNFTVGATGTGLTYQWYYKRPDMAEFSAWSNQKTDTLSFAVASRHEGMMVYCVIKNASGTTEFSETAEVIFGSAPVAPLEIVSQPRDAYCQSGDEVNFTVGATGTGLTYQWYYRRTDMPAFTAWTTAKSETLTFSVASRHEGMEVYCVVKDASGEETVTNTVKVIFGVEPLVILSQPSNAYCQSGDTVNFTVEASGTGLTYQWFYKRADMTGYTAWTTAKSETLTFSVASRHEGMEVYCVVTDANGDYEITDTVAVIFGDPSNLTITRQPESLYLIMGQSSTFVVGTNSDRDLNYVWTIDGEEYVAGPEFEVTTDMLIQSGAIDKALFGYTPLDVAVQISDGATTVQSNVVTLTVNPCNHDGSWIGQEFDNDNFSHVYECEVCGIRLSRRCENVHPEYHGFGGHDFFCDVCGYWCGSDKCVDEDNDGYCDVCGANTTIIVNCSDFDSFPEVGSEITLFVETSVPCNYQWQIWGYDYELDRGDYSDLIGETSNEITLYVEKQEYVRCIITVGNEGEDGYIYDFVDFNINTGDHPGNNDSDITIAQGLGEYNFIYGEEYTLFVAAHGEDLTYQWQILDDGVYVDIPGETDFMYSGVATAGVTYLRVIITDINGNWVECEGLISVDNGDDRMPLEIEDMCNTDACVYYGYSYDLYVNVVGGTYYKDYEWQYLSESGRWFTVNHSPNFGAVATKDGRQYRCIITDGSGDQIISDIVTIRIVPDFEIISEPPMYINVVPGESATLEVEAVGIDLSYQWFYASPDTECFDPSNATAIEGATKSSVVLSNLSEADSGYYFCIVRDCYGQESMTSAISVLVLDSSIEIIRQPQSTVARLYENFSFYVWANSGYNNISYQWQVSYDDGETWSNYPIRSTYSNFDCRMTHRYDGAMFRCELSDSHSVVYTDVVTVTLYEPLNIYDQSYSAAVCEGDEIQLYVNARGTNPNYQWFVTAPNSERTPVENLSDVPYELVTIAPSVVDGENVSTYIYNCIISNDCGDIAYSHDIVVRVSRGIVIVQQPQDIRASYGSTAVTTVVAMGQSLSYRWQISFDGNRWIDYDWGPELYIGVGDGFDNLRYRCVIRDDIGNRVVTDEGRLTTFVCLHEETFVQGWGNLCHTTLCCDPECNQGISSSRCYDDNGDNLCDECGFEMICVHPYAESTNNGDGTHRTYCYDCSTTIVQAEPHNYVVTQESYSWYGYIERWISCTDCYEMQLRYVHTAEPVEIELNETIEVTIDEANDYGAFAFTPSESGMYTISTNSSVFDIGVFSVLTETEARWVETECSGVSGPETVPGYRYMTVYLEAGNTYYFTVGSYHNYCNKGTIQVVIEEGEFDYSSVVVCYHNNCETRDNGDGTHSQYCYDCSTTTISSEPHNWVRMSESFSDYAGYGSADYFCTFCQTRETRTIIPEADSEITLDASLMPMIGPSSNCVVYSFTPSESGEYTFDITDGSYSITVFTDNNESLSFTQLMDYGSCAPAGEDRGYAYATGYLTEGITYYFLVGTYTSAQQESVFSASINRGAFTRFS